MVLVDIYRIVVFSYHISDLFFPLLSPGRHDAISTLFALQYNMSHNIILSIFQWLTLINSLYLNLNWTNLNASMKKIKFKMVHRSPRSEWDRGMRDW